MASTQSQAETQPIGNNVCVIGAGALGLVTTKNLLEQGLQVTTFERQDAVGGTWYLNENGEQTTALEQTSFNTSRQAAAYTDFPFSEDLPLHPPARDVSKYFSSYAEHFNLLSHIKLSTRVTRIKRDEANEKWLVCIKDEKTGEESCQTFDRVAVATGILNTKNMPKVKGIEKFEGDAIHSREFKVPAKYEGKNVIVVGAGASGADSTSFLVKANANKVYLSHRQQFFVLPRVVKGKAFDHTMTRRIGAILRTVMSMFPKACAAIMTKGFISMRKNAFPWLTQHESFTAPRTVEGLEHRIAFFSDDLAENLRDGKVETLFGIQEITGPKSVTLTDGRVLDDIDAIIFCSGYHFDLSLISGPGDPRDPEAAPDHFKEIESTPFYDPENKFPRLYRGFISDQYPESLAFLGHVLIMKPPIVLYDIISMALASVWTGSYPIAPPEERRKDIDTQYRFVVETLKRGPVPHPGFRLVSTDTYDWLNRAAGTGIERLRYCSWESFKLWWNDSKLYYMLMDGFDSPAAYRLFDIGRGRKPWPGARAQIEGVNRELKELGEAWKREQKEKKKKSD